MGKREITEERVEQEKRETKRKTEFNINHNYEVIIYYQVNTTSTTAIIIIICPQRIL